MNSKQLALALALGLAGLSVPVNAQQETSSSNAVAQGPAISQAPYIQALSPTSVAILWRTREPAYGWVEYGETQAFGTKCDAAVYGLRKANITEHRVVLEGLRPGTSYWYQVAFKPIRKFQAYKVEFGPEERSEPVKFQTLPARDQRVTMLVFNDLHTNKMIFQQLRQAVSDRSFDFTFFNGDCFNDPTTEQTTLAYLATYTKGMQADRHPIFFGRGNHETRGAYARDLPRLLAWPGDKPYFAFSAGPVRFVVLDVGEDKPDTTKEYSGLVDFTGYRAAETEWIKTEVASREYQNATWRVLIHHIPIYQPKESATNRPPAWKLTWRRLLKDADLSINGHTHTRTFLKAGAIGNPYPMVVGGGPTTNALVMLLEADQEHLKLRTIDIKGKEVFPVLEKKRQRPYFRISGKPETPFLRSEP